MDAGEIFLAWHELARTGEVERLLDLYTDDAVFESPLVPVLTDGELEICRGRAQLRRFLAEGVRRRPNELVRWYRTGEYLSNERLLVWEYPRVTPDGNQVDICEVIEIETGKICRHRVLGLGRLQGVVGFRARAYLVRAPGGLGESPSTVRPHRAS